MGVTFKLDILQSDVLTFYPILAIALTSCTCSSASFLFEVAVMVSNHQSLPCHPWRSGHLPLLLTYIHIDFGSQFLMAMALAR